MCRGFFFGICLAPCTLVLPCDGIALLFFPRAERKEAKETPDLHKSGYGCSLACARLGSFLRCSSSTSMFVPSPFSLRPAASVRRNFWRSKRWSEQDVVILRLDLAGGRLSCWQPVAAHELQGKRCAGPNPSQQRSAIASRVSRRPDGGIPAHLQAHLQIAHSSRFTFNSPCTIKKARSNEHAFSIQSADSPAITSIIKGSHCRTLRATPAGQ